MVATNASGAHAGRAVFVPGNERAPDRRERAEAQRFNESEQRSHSTSGQGSVLAAALHYADSGIPIFPCNPENKRPLTSRGFKDATTDTGRIRSWWAAKTSAMIGRPTGAAAGIVVLDVDNAPEEGKDGAESLTALIRLHSPLPETWEVLTPRGGRHIYFRHPGPEFSIRCSAGKLAPGLDVRGDGGYVIAPPSLLPDGRRYCWEGSSDPDEGAPLADLPAWLLPMVAAPARPQGDPIATAPTSPAARPNQGDPIAQGARNDTLFRLGRSLRAKGLTDDAVLAALNAQNRALCAPPLDEGEVELIASSVCSVAPGRSPEYARIEEPPPWEEVPLWEEMPTAPPRHSARTLPPVWPPDAETLTATEEEVAAAELHPRCIVEFHTYADVAVLAAAGGSGKSTLVLYEAAHIAIGRPLYGLPVVTPGWTLYIAAEDQRGRILARLREVLRQLDLSPEERHAALTGVKVWDVCGQQVKLIRAEDGNMVLTYLADAIVSVYSADPPVLVVFDPLVSFGASEEAVNSNEQGIITAARRIVKGLNCCVRLVHHTGKVNGRAGTLDQYSARGGSALSDGARMVSILAPWTSEDAGGGPRPPPGCSEEHGTAMIRYARAKLSYCKPQPMIWLGRRGFSFEHYIDPPKLSPAAARSANADQVERYLTSQLTAGRYHTSKTLEDSAEDLGLTRADLRRALRDLRVTGRVSEEALPKDLRQGGRKTYLHCAKPYLAGGFGEVGEESPPFEGPTSPALTTSPPYREKKDGEVDAAFLSPPIPHLAGTQRRGTARLARYPEENHVEGAEGAEGAEDDAEETI